MHPPIFSSIGNFCKYILELFSLDGNILEVKNSSTLFPCIFGMIWQLVCLGVKCICMYLLVSSIFISKDLSQDGIILWYRFCQYLDWPQYFTIQPPKHMKIIGFWHLWDSPFHIGLQFHICQRLT